MQNIKVEHNVDTSKIITPERRAQNREKQLLTFVIRATARDQEKNVLISKLHREMSEVVDHLDALQSEVKLKDKILHAKDDELMIFKSENEALKQQLQLLLTSKSTGTINVDDDKFKDNNNKIPLKRSSYINLKKTDNNAVTLNNHRTPVKPANKASLKRTENDVAKANERKTKPDKDDDPVIGTPEVSRMKSLKKPSTPKENVTNLFYTLRKRSKK